MNQTTFELLSILMRYWFVFLILAILYLTVRNAWQEFQFTRRNVENDVMHMYWFKMVDCPDRSTVGNMVGLRMQNYIGSRKSNDIYLPFQGVSKEHALLKYRRKGFRLTDLGSTYGTYVNGEEIKKNYLIKNKDIITIGAVSLMYLEEKGGERPQ